MLLRGLGATLAAPLLPRSWDSQHSVWVFLHGAGGAAPPGSPSPLPASVPGQRACLAPAARLGRSPAAHPQSLPASLLPHPQLCLDGMQCAECAELERSLSPLTATAHVPACLLQHLPPHVQIPTADNATPLASWAGLCMLGEMLASKTGRESVGFFRKFLLLARLAEAEA